MNNIFVGMIILVLFGFSFLLVGGKMPTMPSLERIESEKKMPRVAIVTTDPQKAKDNLQMHSFPGTIIPTPTGMCDPNKTVDVMFTIDYSGSMEGEKLLNAKRAVKRLVEIIETNPANRMGINSFNESAWMYMGLTGNFSSLKSTIEGMPDGEGFTCIKCGIEMANTEIGKRGRANIKKVDILLTDGNANRPEPEETALQLALNAAKRGFESSGIAYYTVGYSASYENRGDIDAMVNASLLGEIASVSKGKYFFTPTENDLQRVLEEVGQLVCN